MEERRSQICLGLDPDPARIALAGGDPEAGGPAATADEIERWCREVMDLAAPSCIAVKPQLACFERLGASGWHALTRICERAKELGLLVIADGKRGDVPVTARAYAQALFGSAGLSADAATLNPLLGRDALEPFIEGAAESQAGVFILVRTSNPGAAQFQDLDAGGSPLHEHFAALVAGFADDLPGSSAAMSGAGAVVGATAPQHLERLRALMPKATFLLPGVGAQGADVGRLGPVFRVDPAGGIVAASRSIANADDPACAAATLREAVWDVSRN